MATVTDRSGGVRLLDLLVVVVLCAVAYGVYSFLNPDPLKTRAGDPAPLHVGASRNVQRVMCPACGGEGQLMLRRVAGRPGVIPMGGGGADKPYGCPVCGARGFRDMEVPAEAHLCPDCAGMGKRLYDPTTRGYVPNSVRSGSVRYTMRPCMRCHSLGYLKTPPVR